MTVTATARSFRPARPRSAGSLAGTLSEQERPNDKRVFPAEVQEPEDRCGEVGSAQTVAQKGAATEGKGHSTEKMDAGRDA